MNLSLKKLTCFYLVEKVQVFQKFLHQTIKNKIKVPMNEKTRSLNVAMSVAIITSEALRQNNLLK